MLEEDPERNLRKEMAMPFSGSDFSQPSYTSSRTSANENGGQHPVTVFELESNQRGEDDPFGSKVGGTVLSHEAPWYARIYRRRVCLCTSFISLFFFIWYLTSTNKSCRVKMSQPHESNRAFSTEALLMHISDESSSSPVSTAVIGKKINQELRFVVLGNFGRDGFCYQTDVAIEMDKAARTSKASFIINTGNAFFPGGLQSPNEEQVNTSWRNVYNRFPYLRTLPWYSAVGEAERVGDVQAVVNLAKIDPQFIMDSAYYDRIIPASVGNFTLHLIVLDTTALIRTKKQQNDEQLLWLAQTLKRSNSSVRIVVGFHTPFGDPTLGAYLVPILEKSDDEGDGPLAYFSGRELTMQWFKAPKGTHFFISGAAAEYLKNENPFQQPLYTSPAPGFLVCSLGYHEKTGEVRLKTAFVSAAGDLLKVVDTTGT